MVPMWLLASITPMLWNMGSGAPTASDSMVQNARNGEFIWKYYPPGALKRGEQGRVAFKLTIEPTVHEEAIDHAHDGKGDHLDGGVGAEHAAILAQRVRETDRFRAEDVELAPVRGGGGECARHHDGEVVGGDHVQGVRLPAHHHRSTSLQMAAERFQEVGRP